MTSSTRLCAEVVQRDRLARQIVQRERRHLGEHRELLWRFRQRSVGANARVGIGAEPLLEALETDQDPDVAQAQPFTPQPVAPD